MKRDLADYFLRASRACSCEEDYQERSLTEEVKEPKTVSEGHFSIRLAFLSHIPLLPPLYIVQFNALCSKSNWRYDIKAEKREELESKSSHKSDIWPPAASKKWGEIYWKYIFQTLEAIFPYKGVFFTKVVKANIIAFIKTKFWDPFCPWQTPPSKNVSPYCIVHWLRFEEWYKDRYSHWHICNFCIEFV